MSYFNNIFDGKHNRFLDIITSFLSPSEVRNMWDGLGLQSSDFKLIRNPIHKFYLELSEMTDSTGYGWLSTGFENWINEFGWINSLEISEFTIFENMDTFFENLLFCNGDEVDIFIFRSIMSYFAIHKNTTLMAGFLNRLSNEHFCLCDTGEYYNSDSSSFAYLSIELLGLGQDPDIAKYLIDLRNKEIPFIKENEEQYNEFIFDVIASLSLWGHFDAIDELLETHNMDKETLKENWRTTSKLPLQLGLVNTLDYWYCKEHLTNLDIAFYSSGDYNFIPEKSWIWLSNPDKIIFWNSDKILSQETLQNEKLMNILIKSSNFSECVRFKGITNSLKLDRVDLFDFLLNNAPENLIEKEIKQYTDENEKQSWTPFNYFLQSFTDMFSRHAWFDSTDEEDEKLFVMKELSKEIFEKRKRIRHYGRGILQIKGITRFVFKDFDSDNYARKILLFKWIESSSDNDCFMYQEVINNLQFTIDLKKFLDFPPKDFQRLVKCCISEIQLENRLNAIHEGRRYEGLNNTIDNWSDCLIHSLIKNAPIETVLFVFHNAQLFYPKSIISPPITSSQPNLIENKFNGRGNCNIDSILNANTDDQSILIKFLFGLNIYTHQNTDEDERPLELLKSAINNTREALKQSGKVDIFEGLNEDECVITNNVLAHLRRSPCIISNMNICLLLREKYDINLIINIDNMFHLLRFPSILEDFISNQHLSDCYSNSNVCVQTLAGTINIKLDCLKYENFNIWDENFAKSLNYFKKIFESIKGHFPKLIINCMDYFCLGFAKFYPSRIEVKKCMCIDYKHTDALNIFSYLAKKHVIIDFESIQYNYQIDSNPTKEILDLFGKGGLELEPLTRLYTIKAEEYPSLSFLEYILEDTNSKIFLTIDGLNKFGNDLIFKQLTISRKSQFMLGTAIEGLSIKDIENHYEILSNIALNRKFFYLSDLTSNPELCIMKAKKFPALFVIHYDEQLLDFATLTGNLPILNEFLLEGIPNNFSYKSIQTAFEKGLLETVKWWANSGLLNPCFSLNIDPLIHKKKEELLKWASANKELIKSCSFSSTGTRNDL